MSISQLTRLLATGEYRRCLEEASLLLATEGYDTESRARIQAAICKSHLELYDYFAAVEAGQLAVTLAEEVQTYDVLGFALVDLATAQGCIRQYMLALQSFSRYLRELPAFTAARCMEGLALKRMAWTLQQSGSPAEALQRYHEALAWFDRFGDLAATTECVSAIVKIHLDRQEYEQALAVLRDGERYVQEQTQDRKTLTLHLLDRALFLAAIGKYQDSNLEAFRALELTEGDFEQQCRAHLILCRNALMLDQPKDALNFAMGARVAAIDGRIYALEFEASEILFRLLRERGTRLIRDLEEEYYRAGVDIFHYISKQIVDRMSSDH